MHSLFPNRVQLEPVTHKYYNQNGEQYLSVSALLKMMGEKFEDTPAYARATAETRQEWKKIGNESAGHGTRIHNALELFNKTGQILETDREMELPVKDIISTYSEYHATYDEICLYDNEYRVAGTTDKICALSNRKDCEVDLADYKTNNRNAIVYFNKYKKRLYHPFEHLQDCNYVKYSFQLSVYAFFFERLTGRKVRQLFIHFIPPDNMMNHKRVPVMYMKNDVKLLLDTYRYKIIEELNGQNLEPAF